MGLLPAMRAAAHSVFGRLTSDDRAALRQRTGLIVSVPELRGAVLEQFGGTMGLLSEAAAERTGRRPDDLTLRVAVGAALGAWLAAVFVAIEDPETDIIDLMDEAIGQLEAGLKL
jgi:hypothetical protein